MQSISTTSQYLLQTRADGHGYISVDGYYDLILTSTVSNALKFGFSVAPDATKWNICTKYGSSNFCLDQSGLNATQALIAVPGYFSGQQWTVKGNAVSSGSTYWTLQSDFAGPSKYLAITNVAGPGVYMLTDPIFMYWLLVETDNNGQPITNTSSPTSSTSTSIGSSSITSTSQTNTAGTTSTLNSNTGPTSSAQSNSSNGSHSSGLSTGPIVGIALGSIAIVLLAVFAIFFLCYRRRKSRPSQHTPPELASSWRTEEPKYMVSSEPRKRQPDIVEAPSYPQSWEAPTGVDRDRHELEGSWHGSELRNGTT